jgi:hypothetical protein
MHSSIYTVSQTADVALGPCSFPVSHVPTLAPYVPCSSLPKREEVVRTTSPAARLCGSYRAWRGRLLHAARPMLREVALVFLLSSSLASVGNTCRVRRLPFGLQGVPPPVFSPLGGSLPSCPLPRAGGALHRLRAVPCSLQWRPSVATLQVACMGEGGGRAPHGGWC